MGLLSFPEARQLGASLLASAGVLGIVAGLAAKPLFSNLIAGLQLALAQPIRMDDVLIVKGEWGRVEEITGTYVVIKIWDERRLIVPLTWFIENPFENWTRTGADILGTIFLHVDYATPIEPLRQEAARLVRSFPEWDGRVFAVQVTDADERTIRVRVLVSAGDSGKAFDLRCKLREALIAFLAREYPSALPQVRILDTGRQAELDPRAAPSA
jgi:small-conductance mechanosensitive channel